MRLAALYAVLFATLWIAGHPPIPPSARVWPAAFREAICTGYELSLGQAPLALPENTARVARLLEEADYPDGAFVAASLERLLDAYRRASAEPDIAARTLILGTDGHDFRYLFYDAITALTARTGEHCSA